MEDFFDKDEKENQFYKEFFAQFDQELPNGGLIGIQNDSKLDYTFFKELDSFSRQIEALPEIAEVVSVTNLQNIKINEEELVSNQLLDLTSLATYETTKRSLDSIPFQKYQFLSRNDKAVLLYFILADTLEIDSLVALKLEIDELAAQHPFAQNFFIDLDFNNHLLIQKIQKDSARLMGLALALVLFILIFFFRSTMGVIIPITIVVGTVVWIMGTVVLCGIKVNVLTIAIPVIVSVICLSDVIHVISRYAEEKTGDAYAKIKATQKDILRAIILTTITTALGFLSLTTSNIPVFKEFGGFTALGVVYALVLAYFVLPTLLYYSQQIKVSKVLHSITPKRLWAGPTLLITGIFSIACAIGISKVHHNNYFYEDMNEDDEVGHVFLFMEKEMNGLRDLTLAITLKDSTGSVFDSENLKQIEQLEHYVQDHYDAVSEMSIISTVKQVNRSMNNGYALYYRLPEGGAEMKRVRGLLVKNAASLKLRSFVSKDRQATFLKTKTKDQGSYATFKLNDSLDVYVKNNLSNLKVEVSGQAHIVDKTNVNVSEGMIWNLGIIILLIFVMISLIFRSFFIGIFSLLPNILPLLAITAVVGWMEFGMNVATTIVYTIAFGIAVDDTIHFLVRYKIEKEKGLNNKQAVLNSVRTSGGAIILTTIILVAGFGVLITSHFYANYITGLLVCIGMIMALLCDLFLLPLVLTWFKQKNE